MVQSLKDKLKEIENQNQLLTDNLVDAVWILNAGTLVYEYITPSIYDISGYTAEELINTSIADRLMPKSLEIASSIRPKSTRSNHGCGEQRTPLDRSSLHPFLPPWILQILRG